jgi:hypothetical protein
LENFTEEDVPIEFKKFRLGAPVFKPIQLTSFVKGIAASGISLQLIEN